MEHNKMWMQELTLLHMAVNELVDLTHLDPDSELVIFAEHLVGLKMKPFKGTTKKKEIVGSLFSPIFLHLGIRLNEATTNRSRLYLDEAHLKLAQWIKESRLRSFRSGAHICLLQLPARHITDFDGQVDMLRFQPDEILLRNLQDIPCRVPRVRRAPATQGPPEAPLPDFPIIPELPIRDHRDFQRV